MRALGYAGSRDSRRSKMRKVRVVSRKYNGALRDEYETYLYAETEETITLFSEPGLGYWHHQKAAWFEAEDGLIEIYFKHRWYNVWHICEQVSHTNLIYVNIAMPATLQASGIEWTDLDLDYRVHPDNSVELLDQAEFEQNRQSMGYPPDLVEQVQVACREVETGLRSRTYPFDYERQVELYFQIKADLRGASWGNVA
jgi:protein associated with RNAse G/E